MPDEPGPEERVPDEDERVPGEPATGKSEAEQADGESETEETRVEELPPAELGPVPVTIVETEPHWYGVTPQGAVLAVAFAAAGVGIALLALGSTVIGAVLLGLGAIVLAGLFRGPVAAALAGPTEVWRTAFSARLSSGARLAVLRRELDAIARDREGRLHALGGAVYRGEDDAVGPLRQELEQLDRRERETRAEIERTVADAGERIRVARLGTARTEAVSLDPQAPQASPHEQDR